MRGDADLRRLGVCGAAIGLQPVGTDPVAEALDGPAGGVREASHTRKR